MADDWDLHGDDLDLDDADFDWDMGGSDAKDDKRAPIEKVAQGAMDAINTKDHAKEVASLIAQNALPREYRELADSLDSGLSDLTSLYDDVKSELSEATTELKKTLSPLAEKLPDFLSDGIKNSIKDVLKTEADEYERKADPDSDNIALALKSMLEGQQADAKEAEFNAQLNTSAIKIEAEGAQTNARISAHSNSLLGRLVSYNDKVNFNYQQKALELQHRQYYASRDTLKTLTAMAINQREANKSIVHNTSLPDVLKINVSEEFLRDAREKMLGSGIQGIADYSSNFRRNLKENAKDRITSLGSSALEAITTMASAAADGSDAIDMVDEGSQEEIAGAQGATEISGFLAKHIGSKLRRMLSKHPAVANYAKDIEYFLGNYPAEVNKLLEDWDGTIFPESMIKRFPFLENINAGIIADELRGIAPTLDDQSLSLKTTTGNRGSLFEDAAGSGSGSDSQMISGFLSRILQQLTIANNPEDSERTVFSLRDGRFMSESDAVSATGARLFNATTRRRKQSVADIQEGLTERFAMDAETKEALSLASLDFALANKPFRMEEFLESSRFNKRTKEQVTSFFAASGANRRKIRDVFTTAFKEMSEGQSEMQYEINRLSSIGENELLEKAGILSRQSSEQVVISAAGKTLIVKSVKALAADKSFTMSRLTKEDIMKDAAILSSPKREEIEAYLSLDGVIDSLKKTSKIHSDKDIKSALTSTQEHADDTDEMIIDNDMINLRTIGGKVDPYKPEGRSFAGRRGASTGGGNSTFTSELDLEALHESFFTEKEGMQGIPVHLLTGDIDSGGQTGDDRMFEMVRAGMVNISEILAVVAASGAGGQEAPAGILERLTTLTSNSMGAFGKIGASYVKGVYGLASSVVGAGGNITGGVLGVLGRLVGRTTKSEDVYVEGTSTPVLTAAIMRAGGYIDSVTRKTIKSIKDIKGDVLDKDGNVVLSTAQIETGIFNKEGMSLEPLVKLIKAPFAMLTSGVAGYYRMLTSIASKGVASTKSAIGFMRNMPRDVYVKGESTPRLIAFVMRNGGYFSKTSGTHILSPSKIDGDVVDNQGNTLLTTADIQKGLVDSHGNSIDMSMATSAIKAAISKTIGLGKSAFKVAKNMVHGGLSSVGKVITSARDFVLGPGTRGYGGGNSTSTLDDIYSHMKAKWPLVESNLDNDRDNDGTRDNSMTELFAARRAKRAKREEARRARREGRPVPEDDDNDSGSSSGMLGMLGKIGSILSGGFSKLQGIFGTISGFLGAGGLAGAGTAVTGALATAGTAVVGGLATAGTAIAGAVSLPVVAAVAAGAAVAYGGYKGWNYFSQRTEVEPFERLRFLQYGILPNDKDFVMLIRNLEDNVIDEISYSGNKPVVGVSTKEAILEWAEDMGVDMESHDQMARWAHWYTGRFLPVLLLHLEAARMADKSLDLTDIDDDIDEEMKVGFLLMVTSKAALSIKTDPYSVVESPVPGKYIFSNKEEIQAQIRALRSTLKVSDDGTALVDKEKSVPEVKAGSRFSRRLAKKRTETAARLPSTTPSVSRRRASRNKAKAIVKSDKKGVLHIMPAEGRISSPFGYRIHPITKRRKMHKGVDIAAPEGTPIYASADGTVLRRAYSKSYGNVIYLRHTDHTVTRYAHMSGFSSDVALSDHVEQGRLIGYMGNTGRSAGVHLHWELRENALSDAKAIDPLTRLSDQSVLKDVAKEDKDVAKASKLDGKDTGEQDLEGYDTLSVSSPEDATKKAQDGLNDASKLANKEVAPQSETFDLTANTKRRRNNKASTQESAALMKLSGALQSLSDNATSAHNQRERMIVNQLDMLSVMRELRDKNEVVIAPPTSKAPPVIPRGDSFNAVVDLSN